MTSGEFQDRLRKADELRKMGINPYPARFESKHSIADAQKLGEAVLRTVEEIAEKPKAAVTIRGRLMTLREHGRLAFANLKDFSGTIQICFMEGILGKEPYKLLRKVDMGDFVGCTGELFMTKHGQLTLLIKEWTLLGKTLRPLPEKWHGIEDQETKYRQRYLDLIMNEDTMQRFRQRSRCLGLIREYLNRHDFTELEFPLLESKASGATARPFLTHHNALDMDVYLRIACELPQKMAIVGGFERTYEIARVFRNEGMDPSHLQEFTMLEWYAAYWNYEDNMNFTEGMIRFLIQELMGTTKLQIKSRDGEMVEVDFGPDWPRLDFATLIENDCGIKIYDHVDNADSLRAAIKKQKIQFEEMDQMGYGNLCDYLYKKVSRPKLIQPCFVINHPTSMKPLARRSDANPNFCESFQLLVNTWEVVNAYSEIVDPVDQEARFVEQALAQSGGDAEAMEMDVGFIRAMQHGMPPISGNGMGIDRLMTLITGQDNLRDLVLFPIMRPTDEDLQEEKALRKQAAKKAGIKPKKKTTKKSGQFVIEDAIFDTYPSLNIGLVVAKGVDNHGESKELLKMLSAESERIQSTYDLETLKEDPKISAWRKAYEAFGAKPKKHSCSVENLYRMILEGVKLKHINKVVDLYNVISLKHMIPLGGDDTDKVEGNIVLRFANGDEPFIRLNAEEVDHPEEGEVIYSDNKEVLCRRWNWRECDKSKMTEDTKNLTLVVEALPPVTGKEVQKIVEELAELIKKYCGGEISTHILNDENPEVEIL